MEIQRRAITITPISSSLTMGQQFNDHGATLSPIRNNDTKRRLLMGDRQPSVPNMVVDAFDDAVAKGKTKKIVVNKAKKDPPGSKKSTTTDGVEIMIVRSPKKGSQSDHGGIKPSQPAKNIKSMKGSSSDHEAAQGMKKTKAGVMQAKGSLRNVSKVPSSPIKNTQGSQGSGGTEKWCGSDPSFQPMFESKEWSTSNPLAGPLFESKDWSVVDSLFEDPDFKTGQSNEGSVLSTLDEESLADSFAIELTNPTPKRVVKKKAPSEVAGSPRRVRKVVPKQKSPTRARQSKITQENDNDTTENSNKPVSMELYGSPEGHAKVQKVTFSPQAKKKATLNLSQVNDKEGSTRSQRSSGAVSITSRESKSMSVNSASVTKRTKNTMRSAFFDADSANQSPLKSPTQNRRPKESRTSGGDETSVQSANKSPKRKGVSKTEQISPDLIQPLVQQVENLQKQLAELRALQSGPSTSLESASVTMGPVQTPSPRPRALRRTCSVPKMQAQPVSPMRNTIKLSESTKVSPRRKVIKKVNDDVFGNNGFLLDEAPTSPRRNGKLARGTATKPKIRPKVHFDEIVDVSCNSEPATVTELVECPKTPTKSPRTVKATLQVEPKSPATPRRKIQRGLSTSNVHNKKGFGIKQQREQQESAPEEWEPAVRGLNRGGSMPNFNKGRSVSAGRGGRSSTLFQDTTNARSFKVQRGLGRSGSVPNISRQKSAPSISRQKSFMGGRSTSPSKDNNNRSSSPRRFQKVLQWTFSPLKYEKFNKSFASTAVQ